MNTEHAAAHLVAKHLREIAALLPRLSPEGRQAFLPNWDAAPVSVDAIVGMQTNKAAALEATAPFEPVTGEQRAAIRQEFAESIGDLNYRERADLVTEDWTEAEWRMEQDDQDACMCEEVEYARFES